MIVIGGGVAGCSVAYHLAKHGASDVVLLEQAALSAGTTWHSTGNMETYRDDPLMFDMVRYAVSCFAQVQAESGQDIGWRNVGRVMYTDQEARMDIFQAMPETGTALGIEIELLTPVDIASRLPIIDPAGLLGGVWIPSDARLNPTDLVMAFAKAARRRGVSVQERSAVREILVRGGRVSGVVTDSGTIECEHVVIAAGLWSGTLAQTCGIRLPLYALEHQYLITDPIKEVDASLPLFLSYDDQLYGREEVGGLIIGSLDDHAIPVSSDSLSDRFAFSLLNERWSQFEPYMATAMRRFPCLNTSGIKMLLNGPESFTPDGRMLLGPIPGVERLYCACGFNSNGIALSAAAGRFVAEWITDGSPSVDVTPLDVRRFSPVQAAEAYIRERVTEIPGYMSRLHEPIDDFSTARSIRRSPIHEHLAREGVRFTSVNGWERPAWIGSPGDAGGWLDSIAGEVQAALSNVLVVDRSSDVKIRLDADHVRIGSALKVALPVFEREVIWHPLLARCGGTEALIRVMAGAGRGALLTAGPEQETRVHEWLRRVSDAFIVPIDETVTCALWEFYGPRRHALLSTALEHYSGHERTRHATASCWAGPVEVHVAEDLVLDSTIVRVRSDCASFVWERICMIGTAFGLKLGGHLAEEAIRIERGAPRFGHEASLGVEVHNRFLNEPRGESRPKQRELLALSTTQQIMGFGSNELIVLGAQVIGRISSRVCLPGWPETLLLAVLASQVSTENLELLVHGRRAPLAIRVTRFGRL